jgi:hypothetical protein
MENQFAFNGINGATGEYLLSDVDLMKVGEWASRRVNGKSQLAELRQRDSMRTDAHLGLKEGLDPKDLAQAGWGVIFPSEEMEKSDEKRNALAPLLALRKQQAGPYYREFAGADGLRKGESKSKFLARHGIGPGPADPQRVPYYLLVCAGPQSIPYDFQYQLDVQYAVGRIDFDSLEEYERYARAVVATERGECSRSRRAVFFGVENPDDKATSLSNEHLIQPLAARLASQNVRWNVTQRSGEHATKAGLAELVCSEDGPAILFTASHGLGFPNGHTHQRRHQGALLCQDWPGPRHWGSKAIAPAHYFSSDDVGDDARVGGLVTFHFACYSAGTPQLDEYAFGGTTKRGEIAPVPFVASLPKRLLSHPKGGALAVVGHVERTWGYSFLWASTKSQIGVFESALMRLLKGYPIGAALEYFNERYAELSTTLNYLLEDARFGKAADPIELAGLWTAHNDARSYVLVGDPAVRLFGT